MRFFPFWKCNKVYGKQNTQSTQSNSTIRNVHCSIMILLNRFHSLFHCYTKYGCQLQLKECTTPDEGMMIEISILAWVSGYQLDWRYFTHWINIIMRFECWFLAIEDAFICELNAISTQFSSLGISVLNAMISFECANSMILRKNVSIGVKHIRIAQLVTRIVIAYVIMLLNILRKIIECS